LLGPAKVTPYDVLFKLFSVLTLLHGLILTPLWPAYSEAYTKGDFNWLKNQLGRQVFIAFMLFAGALLLAFIGPWLVSLWMGSSFNIKRSLYFMFALFIVFSVWNNVFAYFVNAIGDLNVQLGAAVIAAGLNIPLSIFFVKVYAMGLNGIILATVISLSIYSLFGPIQVLNIIKYIAPKKTSNIHN